MYGGSLAPLAKKSGGRVQGVCLCVRGKLFSYVLYVKPTITDNNNQDSNKDWL